MDIVLGVSMTPTTVRMVLVEGEKGDGATVDHDVFEVSASGDSATLNAADQVVQAVLGTQESAQAGGHHLKSIGVTWTDHTDASRSAEASVWSVQVTPIDLRWCPPAWALSWVPSTAWTT